jgi:hypothetical protein
MWQINKVITWKKTFSCSKDLTISFTKLSVAIGLTCLVTGSNWTSIYILAIWGMNGSREMTTKVPLNSKLNRCKVMQLCNKSNLTEELCKCLKEISLLFIWQIKFKARFRTHLLTKMHLNNSDQWINITVKIHYLFTKEVFQFSQVPLRIPILLIIWQWFRTLLVQPPAR